MDRTVGRELLMRLLTEIDQQLTGLGELLEGLDMQSDEASEALPRMVCLEAARIMVEDKLNLGENSDQPTLFRDRHARNLVVRHQLDGVFDLLIR